MRKLRLGEVKVVKELGINQVSDPDSRDKIWNGWNAAPTHSSQISKAVVYGKRTWNEDG